MSEVPDLYIEAGSQAIITDLLEKIRTQASCVADLPDLEEHLSAWTQVKQRYEKRLSLFEFLTMGDKNEQTFERNTKAELLKMLAAQGATIDRTLRRAPKKDLIEKVIDAWHKSPPAYLLRARDNLESLSELVSGLKDEIDRLRRLDEQRSEGKKKTLALPDGTVVFQASEDFAGVIINGESFPLPKKARRIIEVLFNEVKEKGKNLPLSQSYITKKLGPGGEPIMDAFKPPYRQAGKALIRKAPRVKDAYQLNLPEDVS